MDVLAIILSGTIGFAVGALVATYECMKKDCRERRCIADCFEMLRHPPYDAETTWRELHDCVAKCLSSDEG